MLASVKHILPLTNIRRERLLPIPGKVVVRKGQKVNATDTVAEADLKPVHLLVEVARGLGMPPEKVDALLQCKPGTQLAEGDIIAGPVGFPRRVVRAPREGRVVLAGSGQVLLEVQDKPFELKAGLSGTVQDLIPERGVVIETTGALIQGVWGNGGIDFGLLTVLSKGEDDVLTADRLDVSMRGSIVLAGHVADVDVLRTAAEMPLRGMILSSMEVPLRLMAFRMSLPVILLEGFGFHPMNPVAFRLLSTQGRREVALNAEPWDRFAGTRPEVVITLPSSGELVLPQDADVFSTGKQVRVVSAPYLGKTGTIQSLPGVSVLPSGVRAPAAEIRMEDGVTVVLPLTNLEILE